MGTRWSAIIAIASRMSLQKPPTVEQPTSQGASMRRSQLDLAGPTDEQEEESEDYLRWFPALPGPYYVPQLSVRQKELLGLT